MNVTTLEASPAAPRTAGRTAPTRPGVRRPRRPGPGTGPAARPARPLAAPSVARTAGPAARSCTVETPVHVTAEARSSWRLTERGIALVLVTGLLIATAALAVVGLTALRVTGEQYHGVGQSVLVQP